MTSRTMELQTPASAAPGASCSAIPAPIPDERDQLIEALKLELDAFRRESQWMKKLKETARAWADAKAPREHLGAMRSIIELRREVKELKQVKASPINWRAHTQKPDVEGPMTVLIAILDDTGDPEPYLYGIYYWRAGAWHRESEEQQFNLGEIYWWVPEAEVIPRTGKMEIELKGFRNARTA